jgi:hypothetical protein
MFTLLAAAVTISVERLASRSRKQRTQPARDPLSR